MIDDDAKLYHALGVRDARASLCAIIRTDGLVEGVRHMAEQLRRVAPENPHVEPVLKILNGTKITAIHSGGDWYDASADYVILPAGADIQTLATKYQEWYKTEYCLARKQEERPKFLTLGEWLLEHGAKEPTENDLEIFEQ